MIKTYHAMGKFKDLSEDLLGQLSKAGKMSANMSISMPAVFTGKYRQILENTGKYWLIELTISIQ